VRQERLPLPLGEGWGEGYMQKTKIIATIGPASEKANTLKKMILAGMDVARLNMSHRDHAYHLVLLKNIREVATSLNRPVAIILDLQGPKIRTGQVAKEGIAVKKGDQVVLIPENSNVSAKASYLYIPIQFPRLYKYAKTGQTIYIDDAAIELKVVRVKRKTIECQVINDGVIKSKRGLNLPGANIKCPSLSAKDLADLEFGIKNKVDFVALSYVSNEQDVLKLRKYILKLEKKFGFKSVDFKKLVEPGKWSGVHTRIISKIERPDAVKNFDKILEASDAIMIARGDLGIEIPLEDLPLIQKGMINKCLRVSKPVIVATQMLNSMITKPYPTRAEVSDVANAILDGTDAIMLSGETASGKYPIKTIKVMDKIARETEPAEINKIIEDKSAKKILSTTRATARNCQKLAEESNAKVIICTTTSGFTARIISSLKPRQKIIALSPSEITQRQLNLSWNIFPYLFKKMGSFDKFITDVKQLVIKEKIAKAGETIIICSSHPLGYQGQTNLIKIEIL